MYRANQCPGGCGFPVQIAWHPDNDGLFIKSEDVICWACSARDEKEVRHARGVIYTRTDDDPLRFDFDPWSLDPYTPEGGER